MLPISIQTNVVGPMSCVIVIVDIVLSTDLNLEFKFELKETKREVEPLLNVNELNIVVILKLLK